VTPKKVGVVVLRKKFAGVRRKTKPEVVWADSHRSGILGQK
jgi:hypothetical protein